MNTDVKPLTAVLVITVAVLLFGAYFWLSEKQSLLPAPTVLSLTPAGDLSVVTGNQLMVNRRAAKNDSYDLSEMGVDSPLIGDLTWLSDQEILVRTGATEVSLLQRISFGPISEKPNERLLNTDKIIQRCNLQSKICSPLSAALGEMNYPFSAAISQAGLVAIAETSSHQISLYDSQGNQLSVLSDGLYFPNRVRWNGGNLLVANTNENKLQRVTIRDTKLVGLETIKSTKELEGAKGEKRPIDFIKNSTGWLGLVKTTDFTEGRVYQFDENWQEQSAIELPSDGMIMSILSWKGGVVVADTETRQVFAYDGSNWTDLQWPELQAYLAENRDQAAIFRDLLILLYCVMGILFCLGCVIGFQQAIASLPKVPEASLEEQNISEADPSIKWLLPDPKVKKQLKTLGVIFIGIVICMAYFMVQIGDEVFAISGIWLQCYLCHFLWLTGFGV